MSERRQRTKGPTRRVRSSCTEHICGSGRVGLRRRFKAPISSEARVRIPSSATTFFRLSFLPLVPFCPNINQHFAVRTALLLYCTGCGPEFVPFPLAPTQGSRRARDTSIARHHVYIVRRHARIRGFSAPVVHSSSHRPPNTCSIFKISPTCTAGKVPLALRIFRLR